MFIIKIDGMIKYFLQSNIETTFLAMLQKTRFTCCFLQNSLEELETCLMSKIWSNAPKTNSSNERNQKLMKE